MKVCVFPGSFDPISNGHLNLIERASKIFDKVYVLVSFNPKKDYLFDASQRVELIKKCIKLDNIEVTSYDGLVVDFVKKVNASVIIRGLRNQNDYQHELELYYFNNSLNQNIETLLMYADKNFLFTSSSTIKELIRYDGDVSLYIPEEIKDIVISRVKDKIDKIQ